MPPDSPPGYGRLFFSDAAPARGRIGALFYLYLLSCADGSLYCGIAADVARRLAEHNGEGGSKKGAKYTRPRRPVILAWSAPFKTRSAALKAEAALKKLSRAKKLEIISGVSVAAATFLQKSLKTKTRTTGQTKTGNKIPQPKNTKVFSAAANRPSKAKKK